MDISFLLWLQQLRQSLPGPVETLFVLLSYIGDGPALVAIVLAVYWCIDKRAGQFSLFAFGVGNLICQFLKNLVCVYRPWVRDAAIKPASASIEGAGGYSFPSGHVNGTASSLGGLGWTLRKKYPWVLIAAVVVVVLMMFSRLFLGVHTPQDVLVGLIVAVVAIAATQVFLNWIHRYDALAPGHNKDVIAMVVIIVVCVISVIVVQVKPYPMDYVDGVLLVDPVEMQKGSLESAGILMGVAVSWVLERRLIAFSTDDLTLRTRIIRVVVGVAIVGIAYVVGNFVFKLFMPYNFAKMVAYFVVVFCGMFLAPFAFSRIENGSTSAPASSRRSVQKREPGRRRQPTPRQR